MRLAGQEDPGGVRERAHHRHPHEPSGLREGVAQAAAGLRGSHHREAVPWVLHQGKARELVEGAIPHLSHTMVSC